MNIFENLKVWAKSPDGEKIYLEKQSDGIYVSADSDITVSFSEKKRGNLTAVFVSAKKQRLHFAPDYAVGMSAEKITGLKRYIANFMRCAFWCNSEFSSDLTSLHADTQGFIYEKNDGTYSLILPVCDAVYKCTLFGDSDGINAGLSSYYHSLSKIENSLAFVICDSAESPYNLVRDAAEYAFELLGTGLHTREYRRYPEVFEYLGWCSWDAMHINVSESGLIEKCEEFKSKGIPVKWAILDDMWADCRGLNDRPYIDGKMIKTMYSSALSSFEADRERFPQGLKHCIGEMKKYGLKVGIWHPTTGYWKGFDPEGEIAENYGDCLMTIPNGKLVPVMDRNKVFKLYDAFHSFLRRCGADFVKVDNQSFIRENLKNIYPVGVAARELHEGLEASVGKNFDNNMINCMCMASENMWNRPVTSVARCSGDFVPENSDWFKTHIIMCVYSSMFQGEFYYSDFDMWWTDDKQAYKNSMLRAISGGPIYVSDKIGRSNKNVLDPLVFNDGRILRCDRPARPTSDCLFTDASKEKKPLKIFNTCSHGKYGVIAAYNINDKNCRVRGTVSPSDVVGLDAQEFAVYEYSSKKVRIMKRDEKFTFTLDSHDDFELYIVSPFDKNGIAMLGRIDKYMSPAAILDSFGMSYTAYEGGEFAFVSKKKKKFKAVCESGEYETERHGSLFTFKNKPEDKHFALK